MALSSKNRELKKTKIEIIPMIDTMFFLLVFFILSSLGVIKLQGIKIDLPEASNAPSAATNDKGVQLTVNIDKNENIFVDKIPVAAGQRIEPVLESEMNRQGGKGTDPAKASIVISAFPTVRHGTVVTCIDQARDKGIVNFAIATSEDKLDTPSGDSGAPAPSAP